MRYGFVATTLPQEAVLLEFPFGGMPGLDSCYMYGSTIHWRPPVNGYSGSFPRSYLRRYGQLNSSLVHPAAAWRTVLDTGATHALVHETVDRDALLISEWLRRSGAREIARREGEVLFGLR